MEEAFLNLKNQRDELITRNRDAIDGPTLTDTEQIRELKTELKRQKSVYEAQFIEYVSVSNRSLYKTQLLNIYQLYRSLFKLHYPTNTLISRITLKPLYLANILLGELLDPNFTNLSYSGTKKTL